MTVFGESGGYDGEDGCAGGGCVDEVDCKIGGS